MSAASLPLLLRALLLPTIAREHAAAIVRAEAENWGYARFLAYLVELEANDRLQRKIQRQLKESTLPAGKTLDALASGGANVMKSRRFENQQATGGAPSPPIRERSAATTGCMGAWHDEVGEPC